LNRNRDLRATQNFQDTTHVAGRMRSSFPAPLDIETATTTWSEATGQHGKSDHYFTFEYGT
jgi:hypothetical protein